MEPIDDIDDEYLYLGLPIAIDAIKALRADNDHLIERDIKQSAEIERLRAKVTDLSNEAYDYAEQIERLRDREEGYKAAVLELSAEIKDFKRLWKEVLEKATEFFYQINLPHLSIAPEQDYRLFIDEQAAALEKAREALEFTNNLDVWVDKRDAEEWRKLSTIALAAIEELKK